MLPRIALCLAFGALCRAAIAADGWVQRVNNGFGDINNSGVEWLQTFNGKIYAAVGQDNGGTGLPVAVYQSSDLVTWTRVLGPLTGQTDVFFGAANGSAIFFGTKAITPPGQIWKSTDGTTWTQFNSPGTAGFVAAGNVIVAALGIFGSDLYAGYNNANGGQVWRRPVDGTGNWARVVDFTTGTGLGAGGAVAGVSPTYLYVSRGVLYLSTVSSTVGAGSDVGPQLAFLYQSTDGVNWTRNAAVGNGFGDANNLNIASLVEFGDYLYASVHNRVTGGQVWRTHVSNAAVTNGSPWQKVVGNGATLRDGFGSGANNQFDQEVHHLDVGLGFLWATNINVFATGSQVWRSVDGVNWTLSNAENFGSFPFVINRGFPTVELFNNQIVWGGHSTGGAQVWSLTAGGIVTAPAADPAITAQPSSQTVSAGFSAVFTVAAAGTAPLGYQWTKNGVAIPGATNATLTLPNTQPSDAGTYAVTVRNSVGSVVSNEVTLTVSGPASRLANLSVRTAMAAGQILIVGVVVDGGRRDVLVRAAGPALAGFGLTGVMADPRLELFDSRAVSVFSNDDWEISNGLGSAGAIRTTFTGVGAFSFATGSKDAAFVQNLSGAYSIQCRGTGAGVVLVEAYDTGTTNSPRLINVSARNRVGTGDDILIAGFNIAGSGSKQLLIRAIGPKLTAFGVTGALVDPKLEIYDGAAVKLTENDNWSATLAPTFAAVGAFALDAGSKDAALLTTLAPGSYTVQIKGADGGVGEALVEIYEVP